MHEDPVPAAVPADPPAPVPPPEIAAGSHGEAVERALSANKEERDRAIELLRKAFSLAGPSERMALDARLAAALESLPPEERASILTEVFRGGGFGEHAGPPLFDGPTLRLLVGTLRSLPAGSEHGRLLQVLSFQLMHARGIHLLDIAGTFDVTLSSERARLAGIPRLPFNGPLVEAVGEEIRKGLAGADSHLDDDDVVPLFALGGASASPTDLHHLAAFARDLPSPEMRAIALLAVSSVGPSADADAVLARVARDPSRSFGERAIAWQGLRRRGREDLVAAATRQEILRMWEERGLEHLTDVFK